MRHLLSLSAFVLAAALTGGAAEPVLTHIHPAGAQQGSKVSVKLTGSFKPWPCPVHADVPGIVFTPGKDEGNFEVAVAADVIPGPHLIRAFNDEGASAPISMVVDASPQTLELEPNDDFRSPQVLAGSTATCNGRLDKGGDVDSFRVTLQKGQTMVVRVDAVVLASGVDAMLRIVDAGGTTLAFNHDYTTMDPFLVFVAPQDGACVVQVMGQKYPASSDINFAGGEDCVYRLHLSTEPVVRNTWPLAVQRGGKTPVTLEGWNPASRQVEVDEASPRLFPVTFSDFTEFTEAAAPQSLEIPSAVSGRIEGTGGEDRYTFSAAKDAALELRVTGPSVGSLIDPVLKILDKDGKQLATSDDEGGSGEPRLNWIAPLDGVYAAVVSDLARRYGNDYFYRLLITKSGPSVSASIAVHSVKVEAGKAAELKVAVSLVHGFASKLKLTAKSLPPGISAPEVDVADKGGETVIKLTADAASPRGSVPFQLVLREVEGGKEHPVLFSLVSTGENNGVPQGFQKLLTNATDQLWLTVLPAPSPPAPPPPNPPAK